MICAEIYAEIKAKKNTQLFIADIFDLKALDNLFAIYLAY
jgi:hypothetical protein